MKIAAVRLFVDDVAAARAFYADLLQLRPLSERPAPDPSAFVHARKRLGARPLRALFRQLVCRAGPLPGAHYKGWRLLALDGSAFELPDTPANAEHFGRHHNQHGPAAFPQTEVAALCEVLKKLNPA